MFVEQLEGRRLFAASLGEATREAAGVTLEQIRSTEPDLNVNDRIVASKGATVYQIYAAANGETSGPVLAVGIETPKGEIIVHATGKSA